MYYKPLPISCSSSLHLYLHNTQNTEELSVGLPTILNNINLKYQDVLKPVPYTIEDAVCFDNFKISSPLKGVTKSNGP